MHFEYMFDEINCALCGRSVSVVTNHHLVPQSIGKRKGIKPSDLPQVDLCIMCHKQLHALFSNTELAQYLSDIQLLLEHEKIQSYLRFIRKHPGHTVFKAKRGDERKKRK
jgi:hypothetical protein